MTPSPPNLISRSVTGDEARGNESSKSGMNMNFERKRGRGRPKKRRLDTIIRLRMIRGPSIGAQVGDVENREEWMLRTRVSDPTNSWENKKKEKGPLRSGLKICGPLGN
jgi:hypothetical protein